MRKFNFCFANCTSLEQLPLFISNEEAEFTGFLNNCINLKSASVFPLNINSSNFSMCFKNCKKMSLSSNIFGSETINNFANLDDGKIVDMSEMFSIDNFEGTRGTAPEVWNYLYSPSNYVNMLIQTSGSTETKSGVTVTYNTDFSVLINGTSSQQEFFSSESFNFKIVPTKFYNVCLQYNSGSISSSSSDLIQMQIVNSSTGEIYYSRKFANINELSQWKGIGFTSSINLSCKVVLTVYINNTYTNLNVTPKFSEAKVNPSSCFRGHSINTLTNYNEIPSLWK